MFLSRPFPALLAPGRQRLGLGGPAAGPLRSLGPRTARRGTTLEVPSGRAVLVLDRGTVLTTWGPGRHRLDPDDDLALADLVDPRRRLLHLPGLIVVDTGPLGPWAFHGPVPFAAPHPARAAERHGGPLDDRAVHAHGHVVATVTDPVSVVTGLGRRVDLRRSAALAHWLGRQVLAALATTTTPTAPDGVVGRSDLARLRSRVEAGLAGVGLDLVDLGPVEVVAAEPVRTERHRCAERAARHRLTPVLPTVTPGPSTHHRALGPPAAVRSSPLGAAPG